MNKAKSLAEAGVAAFHAQYDAGQTESIYDESGPGMKSALSKPDFVAFLEAVHKKLGNYKSSKETSWKVDTKNFSATNVVLREETTFELGHGTETFTFAFADGAVKLQGYYINSKELVLK